LLSALAAAAGIMTSPSCGSSVATSARAASLDVEISVDKNGPARQGDCFWLDTGITNTGSTDEAIIVWTNHAWSWVSESREIVLDTGAKQNAPAHEVLKPGKRYSMKLSVCRLAGSKQPTSFRLGFVPRAELPVTAQDDLARWGGIFWSNTVTVGD
jgi:hypothetical protein